MLSLHYVVSIYKDCHETLIDEAHMGKVNNVA